MEAEQIEVQETEVQTEVKQDNKGNDWVDPAKDLADNPEKVQERLNNLYKKMKKYEKETREWRAIDKQRQDKILELENATHIVVDHLTERSLSDTESQLKAKMQSALDSGDNASYLDAQDKLIEVKAEKIAKQKFKQSQPKQEQRQERIISSHEAIDEGESDGELAPEDAHYAKTWLNETNERGEALRPWANTEDPEDPDPDYVKAMVIAQKLFTQPAYKNWSVEKKLAEIDRRMGVSKPQAQQTVMGGRLTPNNKNVRVTLTPKQQEIAIATKFGGPKAKTDADHLEAYRKAVEKTKGAR